MSPKEEEGFKKITNLEKAAVYNDIILSILETRCTSCHNQSKKKGELQMYTRQLQMKGEQGGPIVVAGEASKSEMTKRINLRESHDDHMLPAGKCSLTSEHIKLLEWWVNNAAPFEKKIAGLVI
ncbi:c-type cytochrome domain-containing protein [Fodinibius sediminis]|uniref:Planctomycete cytochrome C n=1 Tax=Fodinibius sediminis TaxID=1214077 RepID=A0A521E4P5_9BACT|nr:c-type cytochrome domain-containing protein [Fodinibius sediminis]SMO78906.1 Planctomycete cytochrome C [Fodinibius sediminis]